MVLGPEAAWLMTKDMPAWQCLPCEQYSQTGEVVLTSIMNVLDYNAVSVWFHYQVDE